jgi:hypothetical protein
MLPSFRERLIKRRALLGVVTLLCLLWHILLPSMVNIGLIPTLYSMPTHCLPNVMPATIHHSNTSQHSAMQHDMHSMPMMMAHDASANVHQVAHTANIDKFHTAHAHAVFELAAKIMKHCPLCSHGLEGGLLAPFIILLVALILRWFAVVRSLCHTWVIARYIPLVDYILPFKQAPPLAL